MPEENKLTPRFRRDDSGLIIWEPGDGSSYQARIMKDLTADLTYLAFRLGRDRPFHLLYLNGIDKTQPEELEFNLKFDKVDVGGGDYYESYAKAIIGLALYLEEETLKPDQKKVIRFLENQLFTAKVIIQQNKNAIDTEKDEELNKILTLDRPHWISEAEAIEKLIPKMKEFFEQENS